MGFCAKLKDQLEAMLTFGMSFERVCVFPMADDASLTDGLRQHQRNENEKFNSLLITVLSRSMSCSQLC